MKEIISFLHNLFPAESHDRIVLAGGTVRDMLLVRTCADLDLVAAISGDDLSSLGFRLVEASSGTDIYFRHHPKFGKIEVTIVDSISELEADLARRDFTVNAIAMSLSGTLFDPLAGESDLRNKLLRACSDRSFLNDPLRIFRAFRFECFSWQMAPDTEELIRRQNWSVSFDNMPVERFTNELLKALSGDKSERFFQRMIEFGVGREFLPELFRMPDIPAGPPEHHPEGDLFTHSIQVLQRVADNTTDPLARFCAFYHDIGKLTTNPALYPKHHGHDDAGFALAEEFCKRLCLPTEYRKALAWISRLHGKANKWDELRDSTKLRMAEHAIKAGIVEILPLVSAADNPGGIPLAGWINAVQVARMNTRDLEIDSEKLAAMPIENRSSYILQKRVDTLRTRRLS